jgi:hypothetical protein
MISTASDTANMAQASQTAHARIFRMALSVSGVISAARTWGHAGTSRGSGQPP